VMNDLQWLNITSRRSNAQVMQTTEWEEYPHGHYSVLTSALVVGVLRRPRGICAR
jgi:hypothetical protein